MSAPDLSVVVPVFNEAQVLEANVQALIAHLEAGGHVFELHLVDDGSTDESWAIAGKLAAGDGRIRIEKLPVNRGKGAAVQAGMLAARGERVVFMDADLSTPLEEIERFLGALDSGYEVVIGNRRAPGSQVTVRQPWLREKLGRGFTVLTRILLAPGVHDFTCGFKAFRREASAAIFQRTTQGRWAFDAEVVVIASRLGFKLAQVPVGWHDEPGTKVRFPGAIISSLREILLIRWNLSRGRYE